jgi:preprotein translocase subunit SecD
MVGCGSDASDEATTPTTPTTPSAAGSFELREVLEIVPSSAPEWDALEVTCIGIEGGGSLDCLDPVDAAGQEVVLLDTASDAKLRLAPATITADDVASGAAVELDPRSEQGWGIQVQLTAGGTQAFEDLTSGLVGKQIAIVQDGVVLSAPTVQEPITSGAVQVGNLSETAAEELAQRLSA